MDNSSSKQRIVVFLPNWVGDVVMATPALRALREHFVGDRIVYVARPAAAATIEGGPWADEIIIDPSAGGRSPIVAFLHLVFALRRGHFDLAVLLPNSFRTALLARLGGVHRRAGYARDGRGWLLTTRLAPPRDKLGYVPTPAIDYYNALAAAVGAKTDSRRMELPVSDADAAKADRLLADAKIDAARPIVMLNPGASFGVSKLWPSRRFAALAEALIERHNAAVIINAAPSERTIASEVEAAMRRGAAMNLGKCDNSLGLVKALMRRCRLLVTNDTGARHIAAASGIAVVTIFGSTDPDWTIIHYGRERTIVSRVDCSPCQKKICDQPAGPLYHQCMQSIQVETVLAAAEELLAEDGR